MKHEKSQYLQGLDLEDLLSGIVAVTMVHRRVYFRPRPVVLSQGQVHIQAIAAGSYPYGREGVDWIRGHYTELDEEGRALLAAHALESGR